MAAHWGLAPITALALVVLWLASCAQLNRPGILNEGLSAQAEDYRQQAHAKAMWSRCVEQAVALWEQKYPKAASATDVVPVSVALRIPEVCGPYPGNSTAGEVTPWDKPAVQLIPPIPGFGLLGKVLDDQ